MRTMPRTHSPISIQLSPFNHARACFVVALVLFSLSAGSYYWNESVHYRIYLALGVIFAMLGFGPLVLHALHSKSK
jgi:hypothetical protein